MHFVYIIYSETFGIYYKGETSDISARLSAHNQNKSNYTANKGPWKLVYLEKLSTRSEALKREKMLKKQNRKYIEWLILQPSNTLVV